MVQYIEWAWLADTGYLFYESEGKMIDVFYNGIMGLQCENPFVW